MGVLAGVIAAIAIVWLAIVYEGFRNFLILLVVAGGVYWFYNDQQEKKSFQLIKSKELFLSNVVLSHDYGDSYTVSGEVKNNSFSYNVDDIYITAFIQKCDEKKSCVTVGQNDTNLYTSVPSQQVRTFKGYVTFRDMPDLGKNWSWFYVITKIKASAQRS